MATVITAGNVCYSLICFVLEFDFLLHPTCFISFRFENLAHYEFETCWWIIQTRYVKNDSGFKHSDVFSFYGAPVGLMTCAFRGDF